MGRHQKYLRIFLSFVLAISPIIFINNANAAVGGWTMSNPIAQGASAVYDATKTVVINGKDVVKTSVVKITPNASQVAKVLARTGVTLALTVAVEQILGSVDWVLDPANNSIKYKQKCTNQCIPETGTYAVIALGQNVTPTKESFSKAVNVKNYANEFAAKQSLCYGARGYRISAPNTCIGYKESGDYIVGTMDAFWFEVTKPQEEEKSLPLTTVAAQVISNAESSTDKDIKAGAQVATMAAAADIVKDAETDQAKAAPIVQQLENSAVTATDETATGTQTKNPTNPDVTDLSLEFPAFCGWAPTVCEAAQTVISFPRTLTNWWDTAVTAVTTTYAEAKEWATSESQTDTNLDIDVQDDSAPNTDISFSTSCPAKIPLQFNWNGQSLDFSFDFTMWCQAISTYVYPIVVTLGSLHALYIVTGVRQDG